MLISALFALSVAVAQEYREPELWEVVGQSSRLYGGCIVDHAQRLEPSGEAADLVADAAVAECRRERDLALRALGTHAVINYRLDSEAAARITREGVATWEADYKRQAVREVVRIRAERNR
jgi:hypothetical protein